MSAEWTPLLSGKPLCDYTPEDFRTYVRSLYAKRVARTRAGGKPKAPTIALSLTKKGTVSVKVRRRPKWISRAEVTALETEGYANTERRIYANEIFLALKRLKVAVVTDAEANTIIARTVEVRP